MALRTLDCSLSVAIINLLGEGGNHQPDPEGTFLLGAKGDILTGLQQCIIALYPALQRLQARGWIRAKWGISENKRRAKYYRLTAAGKKRLVVETSKWERLAEAVTRILRPAKEET